MPWALLVQNVPQPSQNPHLAAAKLLASCQVPLLVSLSNCPEDLSCEDGMASQHNVKLYNTSHLSISVATVIIMRRTRFKYLCSVEQ